MSGLSTRRGFLRVVVSGLALDVLACDEAEPPACPTGQEPSASPIRIPDVEDVAAWITSVAEDQLVPELRERVASGAWSIDHVSAGLIVAGARGIDSKYGGGGFHFVIQVRALRAAAHSAPPGERLVPLVYGLLLTRGELASSTFVLPGIDPAMIPTGSGSGGRMIEAVEAGDVDAALLEVTSLARTAPRCELHDTMLELGARRLRALAHEAIFAAKGVALLRDLDGPWAEDVLRSMIYADMTREALDGPEHDDVWRQNRSRTAEIRCDWEDGSGSEVDSLAIARALRDASDPAAATEIVIDAIDRGVGAQAVWDGLVVAGAEAAYGPANYHALTATSALRDAFTLARSPRVRLLMTLQGASVLPLIRRTEAPVAVPLLDLEPAPATLAEVLAATDRAGVERALGYLRSGGDPSAFVAGVASLARTRAFDEHHYKIPDAAFLEAARVAPALRHPVLASARIWAPTTTSQRNLAWQLVAG